MQLLLEKIADQALFSLLAQSMNQLILSTRIKMLDRNGPSTIYKISQRVSTFKIAMVARDAAQQLDHRTNINLCPVHPHHSTRILLREVAAVPGCRTNFHSKIALYRRKADQRQ